MKIFLKILAALGVLIVLVIFGVVIWLNTSFPKVGPAKELTIKSDSATIERGKYLANHVSVCIDCHSQRDWKLFSGPIVSGSEGQGGEIFNQDFGFPGSFTAKNITPYGVGNWTNGEIYRAMSTGLSKKGNSLFPIMPYTHFRNMDIEDAKAIIAYIRTLKPIKKDIPASKADFPMNLILNTIPSEADPQTKPSPDNQLKYGEYIVKMAGCSECHTQAIKGVPVAGKEFAGGMEFKLPKFGTVRSMNITPDIATGIGGWTEEDFVKKFKYYNPVVAKNIIMKEGGMQSVMPWTMYNGMTETDLKAVFAYLRTLNPVRNLVMRFTSELVQNKK